MTGSTTKRNVLTSLPLGKRPLFLSAYFHKIICLFILSLSLPPSLSPLIFIAVVSCLNVLLIRVLGKASFTHVCMEVAKVSINSSILKEKNQLFITNETFQCQSLWTPTLRESGIIPRHDLKELVRSAQLILYRI